MLLVFVVYGFCGVWLRPFVGKLVRLWVAVIVCCVLWGCHLGFPVV